MNHIKNHLKYSLIAVGLLLVAAYGIPLLIDGAVWVLKVLFQLAV